MHIHDNNGNGFEIDNHPDTCPICHTGINPTKVAINYIDKVSVLQVFYKCPIIKCSRGFIASYFQNYDKYHQLTGHFLLRNTAPYVPVDNDIPEETKKLSPEYCSLFNQSSAAEQYGLEQIAGAGYRKALEFLIKDYAIHKKGEEESESIKSAFLGNVIQNHIDDANIRECATIASWLGNDETHYVRKWEEKDIRDLKALIRLTEAWITTNLLTEKYLNEMK